MASSIYEDGKYLRNNQTWHAEDSPWKAKQICEMIVRNSLNPRSVAEIGCGAGGILRSLHDMECFKDTEFFGYDISPQAIELAERNRAQGLSFFNKDFLQDDSVEIADVLLLIDVFEHVEDYMGFLRRSRGKGVYKIFHIPLDIHVSSVVRNAFIDTRYSVGHLHYFTADSALAALKDAGYELVDVRYTDPALSLFRQHPSVKKAIANVPRWIISRFSVPLAARLLGGYSLLVLAQ